VPVKDICGFGIDPERGMNERIEVLQGTWDKVIDRLYHEDDLLYQRTNNFSTVQAFLTAGLAFSGGSGENGGALARGMPYLVSAFGLAFSLFHIILGLRGSRAIQFWRKYAQHLED
jgi:hypothetical protein